MFPNNHWWSKISNYFTTTGISTKESHRYALMLFLETVRLNMSGFNISKTFETICKIYLHLKQKKYVHYADHPKRFTYFSCTDQLNKGLQQVCINEIVVLE